MFIFFIFVPKQKYDETDDGVPINKTLTIGMFAV